MNLSEYAKTETQKKYVEAYEKHGTFEEAGREMGVSGRAIRAAVDRVKVYASNSEDYVPGAKMVDGEGNVKIQWMKPTDIDGGLQEAREEAQRAILEDVKGKALTRETRPHPGLTELLNLYNVTDFHIGMKAWVEETGADWDIKIARDVLMEYVEEAVSRTPKADVSIVSQLGDFFHYDGLDAVTPTSGHLLDADTRYAKMVREGIEVLKYFIERLREESNHVVVLMAEGNHDIASSLWLRELFSAYYSNASDVTVINNVAPFYSYVFGDVGLFFHHGHKVKFNDLPTFFASRFHKEYGATKYRYIHCGHLHHKKVFEHPLAEVEQHQTLAAPDAYAAREGYNSHRSAQVITYHKCHGEYGRQTIRPCR